MPMRPVSVVVNLNLWRPAEKRADQSRWRSLRRVRTSLPVGRRRAENDFNSLVL